MGISIREPKRFIATRRQVLAVPVAVALSAGTARAQLAGETLGWSLPLRNEGGVPGDGFFMHYGYACENTKHHPGWWHTAEDWHRDDGVDTAGAEVLAVHAGEVVWVGSDYPGRVMIVRHDSGLYSVYAHLDFEVEVDEGDWVVGGQLIGRVLAGDEDWHAPSHLHFEMRDFFLNPIVNGDQPQHGVKCGYRCPPGPGYWPIHAPEHPSELGWRNPMHIIQRGFGSQEVLPQVMVAAGADGMVVPLRQWPDDDDPLVEEIQLYAGGRFQVLGTDVGEPASLETSTLGYHVWYQLAWSAVPVGWIRAVMTDDYAVGSDGGPTGVRPVLLPVTPS